MNEETDSVSVGPSAILDAPPRGLETSGHTTIRAQLRRVWIWVALAVIGLAAGGILVDRALARFVRERSARMLQRMVQTNARALELWLRSQEITVAALAESPDIAGAIERAHASVGDSDPDAARLSASEPVLALRRALRTQMEKRGYSGFVVAIPRGDHFSIISAHADQLIGSRVTGYRASLYTDVFNKAKPRVSIPYRSTVLIPDEKGDLRANVPTMLSIAPVFGRDGTPFALLAMRLRPEREFCETLSLGQSGDSGEVYAASKDGWLLSRSRFEDDLRSYGLIPADPREGSMLGFELRAPDVNLTTGERTPTKRHDLPLTRAAAQVAQGQTGGDATPYSDYRGVSVLGAWVYLPEYEMGVIGEIDLAEALGPVSFLRKIFLGLFVLLAIASAAIAVFLAVVAKQARAVRHAEKAATAAGQYVLEAKIGEGGMGAVWRARHAFLRRPTAVKVLEAKDLSRQAVLRFEREVQATAGLSNPHTVAVFDFGRLGDGRFFYAMELLEGYDLGALVRRHGALPEARVVAILCQVCDSLEEAHGRGLVHRDIKPANIFVSGKRGAPDFVKVVDFGLVKDVTGSGAAGTQNLHLTGTQVLLGTPMYMAPEVIDDPRSLDARADIYALGGVGYFLLTGTTPFEGKTVSEILARHLQQAPEPLSKRAGKSFSPRFEAFILTCLAKDPANRPQTIAAVRVALEACESFGKWTRAEAEKWWSEIGAPDGEATLPTPKPPVTPIELAKARAERP